MKQFVILNVLAIGVVCLQPSSSNALAPFKKAFSKRYAAEPDNDAFKSAVKKLGCNLCHIKGEKKDKRNAYGQELAKLIEGNAKERIKKAGAGKKAETERVLEELSKAFDKVEKIKAKSGGTYGDLLKEGKLPVHEGADE